MSEAFWDRRRWIGSARDGQISYSTAASFDQIPCLDGLRAISVLMVMVSHCGFANLIPGGFGVTVFFFISGLLIGRQLLAEREATGSIDLRRFAIRRLLRLYPPLLVAIVVSVPAFLTLGGTVTSAQLLSALLYMSNYAELVFGWTADPATRHGPLDILWSLAVEQHFYLLAPPLLLILPRRARSVLVGLIGLILTVAVWRAIIASSCQHSAIGICVGGLPDRIEAASDTRVDSLLYGVLLAALLNVYPRCANLTGFATGIACLLGSLAWRDPLFRETFRYSLQGIGLLFSVAATLFVPSLGILRRLLATPAMKLVGRLSYSLYLTHWALIVCALQWRFGDVDPTSALQTQWLRTVLPAFVPSALLLAAVNYHGVERPILRLRRRFGAHAMAKA